MKAEANKNARTAEERDQVISAGEPIDATDSSSSVLKRLVVQTQARKHLREKCSHEELVEIATEYDIAPATELSDMDEESLLSAIIDSFDDEDFEEILAEFTHLKVPVHINLCTWCNRPHSARWIWGRARGFKSRCCKREICREARTNARTEYESTWGRCRELNPKEQRIFTRYLGIPLREPNVRHSFLTRLNLVKAVIEALDSGDSRLFEVREFDEKYRHGRDFPVLYETCFERVKIYCDWCLNSSTTIRRGSNTSPYCEGAHCKKTRKKVFEKYQNMYGIHEQFWCSEKRRFRSNLNRILGMPPEDVDWFAEALQNPFSSLDRIRMLDEKYRKGVDVSTFHKRKAI